MSPSSLHEILIALFRERPALVQELLRPSLGEQVPAGAAEEARRLVLRLLARKVGLLGPDLQARVEALDLDRLEALADALLGFETAADLEAWLVQAGR